MRRHVRHPIKLLERIMQIGNKKALHSAVYRNVGTAATCCSR
jgi:hypothetical protein